MKQYKIIVCFFLLLGFSACKKIIEVKETDSIGGATAYQTVANNEQAIVGAYSAMNIEMSILLNAVFADEVKKSEFYNAATVHEWLYSSTDISIRDNFTAFNLYYRIIDRVNRVLQALPNATGSSAADQTLRTRLRGEALFLRAFCHFELYRYYSGDTDPNKLAVAYVETPSLEPAARMQVGPFFQKLKADLVEAKDLVNQANPLTGSTAAAREAIAVRANRLAVTGLQARVALYLKEWTDAITFSTEYINAMPLASRTEFPGIWSDANVSEVAFKLKRTASAGGRIGSLFRGTSSKNTQTGDTLIGTVTWQPSDKIWDAYDKVNDIRFPTYFKDEPILAKAGRSSRIIHKYSGGGYTNAAENVADAKVFRTGEMYLIRAEAKAENNDIAGAAADLNALRAARITAYVPALFASKDDLITAVLEERFKELAYEGHRFWDLRRRNLPVQRLASDAPTTNALTLPAGNFRFRLPIPNAEIQANPLIQQNEGYTN